MLDIPQDDHTYRLAIRKMLREYQLPKDADPESDRLWIGVGEALVPLLYMAAPLDPTGDIVEFLDRKNSQGDWQAGMAKNFFNLAITKEAARNISGEPMASLGELVPEDLAAQIAKDAKQVVILLAAMASASRTDILFEELTIAATSDDPSLGISMAVMLHAAHETLSAQVENYVDEALKNSRSTETVKPGANSGGCYVATSIYGSYDSPQVRVLRRWRDQKLALSHFGRAFIRSYYLVSPTLVQLCGGHHWFTATVRGPMDLLVRNLSLHGYSAEAYEDVL